MSEPAVLGFGSFELNGPAGELRRQGELVKLAPQPFKVLELLVRRSGEVVTRATIREHVWCGDTFVDFEQGLNFCIRQVREALGDTADAPAFIETLPRRGYRFLMPVHAVATKQKPRKAAIRLIVLPFRVLRPDPETDFLAFSLPDALTASLAGLQSLVVRSSLVAARFGGDSLDPKRVGADVDVDMIVTGTLLRAGHEIRVSSQLTDAANGTLLWSHQAQAPLGDLFRVQDELTHRIVASLSLPLTDTEQQLLRRDVPASAKAYEYFLRGNQLSCDSRQWAVARDLYLQCVEEDARYAPAWARLGHMHHVMSKYLPAGVPDGLVRAEAALRKALELNPELAVAHKLLAQLEVDLGRARDAMVRLVERAQSADPELFAGLVSVCRYCGLLDASLAAHARAIALEPKIRTSVPHTWFQQADHSRVTTTKILEFPYIVALSLAELGRQHEAVAALRDLEDTVPQRLRDFVVAARALLEGNAAISLAAITQIISSGFRDPEGLFYLARHLAHLNQPESALELLQRVVDGGYFCHPMMAKDPWLDSLRQTPAFTRLMHQAERDHREAVAVFGHIGGHKVLGLANA